MGTQNITLAGKIPTAEAFFSPFLGALIEPGAIGSGENVFAPAVQGPTQFLNPGAKIPSGERFPIPVLTGGNPALKIFIAGIDRTAALNGTADFSPMGAGSNASATTITSQAIGRATLTFDYTNLNNNTYQPVVGQTVLVVEGGFTLFAGCIDSIEADLEEGSTVAVVYHITALAKSAICDHRVVKQITYTLGTPVQSVILSIVANYLNGEGITTQGVPANLGFLTSDLPFNYTTVTNAFNSLATLSGTVWWVDFMGVLNFSPLTSLPTAPWNADFTTGLFRKLKVMQTLSGSGATSGYRNVQYAVSNLNILPGANGSGSGPAGITQTFTWTNGSPGIVSQYISGVLTPVSIKTNLALGSILSITVNGNPQTVVEYSQFNGQTSTGPNDFLWFYTTNQANIVSSTANISTPTFGPLPGAATVVVVYTPGGTTSSASAAVGTALVPTDSLGNTFGTCGSGIYENVLQVKNISTQADLDAIAAAELAESGGIPIVLTFETDKPGLFVGQSLPTFLPTFGIEIGSPASYRRMLISQLSGTAQTGPLGFGSWFRWQVTCLSNLDPGNWITYMTNLIQQTNNPLPVLDLDPYVFVIGPGSNISAGTVVTNPQYVKRTGLLVELYAGAGVPPVDQTMVITFTDVTQSITLGSVTIPAGSSTRQSSTIPSSLQIYLFANDQITVSVVYNQTGPSPVAAQSVTAGIKTTM